MESLAATETMKIITGNLLDIVEQGRLDVIIHGANCRNTMGSGIAAQIKKRFPEAYDADCAAHKAAKNYLGNISWAKIIRNDGSPFVIVNAYTQDRFGPPPTQYASYDAIANCFRIINSLFNKTTTRFGYPRIGCGRGGANWNIVAVIIDEELKGRDHTLVEYKEN